MSTSGGVTVKDNGANELLKRLRDGAAHPRTVKVGVLSDQPKEEHGGSTGAMSLIEVAAVHEFGTDTVPQRSFIRATVDEHRAEIDALEKHLAAQVLAGEITEEKALNLLGAKVAAWMQARIAQGIPPELKPETIARKGSSKPLVDTGQLRSSVTFLVGDGVAGEG